MLQLFDLMTDVKAFITMFVLLSLLAFNAVVDDLLELGPVSQKMFLVVAEFVDASV